MPWVLTLPSLEDGQWSVSQINLLLLSLVFSVFSHSNTEKTTVNVNFQVSYMRKTTANGLKFLKWVRKSMAVEWTSQCQERLSSCMLLVKKTPNAYCHWFWLYCQNLDDNTIAEDSTLISLKKKTNTEKSNWNWTGSSILAGKLSWCQDAAIELSLSSTLLWALYLTIAICQALWSHWFNSHVTVMVATNIFWLDLRTGLQGRLISGSIDEHKNLWLERSFLVGKQRPSFL